MKNNISFYKKIKNKFNFFFYKLFYKKKNNFYEKIEEILIKYGVGIKTTNKIVDNIKNKNLENSYSYLSDLNSIKEIIKEEFNIIFNKIPIYKEDYLIKEINNFPYVFNIIGINGVGKTTVIGKLLYRFKKKFNILVSAADTFRAAAISQLEILCNKYKINIFKEYESNPSSVVYNSIKYAKSKKIDIVFIDTSGRLHNNKNLLNELKKINNITKKLTYNNSFKNFLILDGTSGNIVFDQIRNFLNYIPIHFIILTKFDLTKKWGIIIGIYDQFNIPIIYISNGENIEDLYEFNKENFFNFF